MSTTKVNMLVEFEFDFNSETNEFTLVNQKILSKGKAKTTKKSDTNIKTSTSAEGETPSVTREDNKLVFNAKAIELIGLTYGDSLSLQFDKKGKVITPVIGNSDITGVKGNKITKSGTVSCRGKSNEVLADYGTVFTVTKGKKEGLFELIGENSQTPTENNDEDTVDDILDDEIDFDTDIDMEEDDKSIEITDFSFE